MKNTFGVFIMLLFVVALSSCDLNSIFNIIEEYSIDYYIDNKCVGSVIVEDGDKIVLDLDKIYVSDEGKYLDKIVEATETDTLVFDYWYLDSKYEKKATTDITITDDVDLYARYIEKKSNDANIDDSNTNQEEIPDNNENNGGTTETPGTGENNGGNTDDNHDHETGIVDNVVYDDFSIHFLELGNEYTGDSTYIKAGDVDILIDAGSRKGSATAIKTYVDKYCTDGKLEYVIGTHGDQDHIAGFVGNSSGSTRTGILYQYEIGTIITASLSNKTTQIYEDYLTAIELCQDKGTKVYDAGSCFNNEDGAQRTYQLADNITMDILYNYYYFNESDDENDYSVCVMFNYNDKHFMLTGDLEEAGEKEMAKYYDGSTAEKTLPHVDLFKAGHHGSKTSTNECLLAKITPDIVCVCCCAGSTEYTADYNNIFPTQEMITRVAKYTDRLYVTTVFNEKTLQFESLNGNIIISSNGTAIGVSATNNIIKLKDSEWFNATVYVDSEGNICSGKGQEDFFTSTTSGVTAVKRRIWPSTGV